MKRLFSLRKFLLQLAHQKSPTLSHLDRDRLGLMASYLEDLEGLLHESGSFHDHGQRFALAKQNMKVFGDTINQY